MSTSRSAENANPDHFDRRTKGRRHGQDSHMSLLDLPDPLLENIITQAAPMAACFLGCTCRRLQALFMEHEPRHLAAMARGGGCPRFKILKPLTKSKGALPLSCMAAHHRQMLLGRASRGKGKNAAEQADIDLGRFFQSLPADLGLLSDSKGCRDYEGEGKLIMFPEAYFMYGGSYILQHAAKRGHERAASVLQVIWPTIEEIEATHQGYAWSKTVRQAAAKCMTLVSYVSYHIKLRGLDKTVVKEMLPVIGNCVISQVLGALGASEVPPGTRQSWKQVQSSGNRRRLCTFYLLKYRGLRVLVTCDP